MKVWYIVMLQTTVYHITSLLLLLFSACVLQGLLNSTSHRGHELAARSPASSQLHLFDLIVAWLWATEVKFLVSHIRYSEIRSEGN